MGQLEALKKRKAIAMKGQQVELLSKHYMERIIVLEKQFKEEKEVVQ